MEYLLGSKKEFREFIESISKKDKIGIISHIDVDGLVSALFLQKIIESRNLKVSSVNFVDYKRDAIKKAFDEAKPRLNKIFISDLEADDYPDFSYLRERADVFLVDHHPISENLKDKKNVIKTKQEYCAGHCIFDLAQEYLSKKDLDGLKWLACLDVITEYGWRDESNFQFIKSEYPDVKKDISIFNSEPGKMGSEIDSARVYYAPDFNKVYNFILNSNLNEIKKAALIVKKEVDYWTSKFKNEAQHFPEKNLYFYYGNPKYNIVSKIATIISSTELFGSTVIFVSDYGDGDFVKPSARNQTGSVDLGKILKKSVEGFENSSGGGHPKAASAIFPKKYLDEFKKRIIESL